MNVSEKFASWASGFSGCDGGDLGSHDSPSIWVCGIEWGGDWVDYDWLKDKLDNHIDQLAPPDGYDSEKDNLDYIYNINSMKLLCAINGIEVSDYKRFALETKPFVKNEHGYFKMNLYPLPFKDASAKRWSAWIHELTGFSNKDEYLAWCREHRFNFLMDLLKNHGPKLIICFGKSYLKDFISSFCDEGAEVVCEDIGGRVLNWAKSGNTLVAVCPFPTSPYGLNSNALLDAFGKRIRQLPPVSA